MDRSDRNLDADLAASSLSDEERWGLQIYRNYTRAFDEHAEKIFSKEVDSETLDTGPLEKLLNIMVNDDPRLLPIVTCGYADDILLETLKRFTPPDIPGATNQIFSAPGQLSTLSLRIKVAFIGQMFSQDLLQTLDEIRKARNSIAHSWSIDEMQEFFAIGPLRKLPQIDQMLIENTKIKELSQLSNVSSFRIRLIWILARLTYEAPLYRRAIDLRLNARSALYGERKPGRLKIIASVAMQSSLLCAVR